MRRVSQALTIIILAAAILSPAVAGAQAILPPGPKVSLHVVAHPIPTHPQWTRIDVPYY
jgi:hypothetical protein